MVIYVYQVNDERKEMKTVIVNASELLAATAIVSKDKSKSVLTGVFVKNDGKNYHIAATDSYKLVVFDGNYDGDEFAAIIPADFIKNNVKKSDTLVRIEHDEDDNSITMHVYDKDMKERVNSKSSIIEGNYPNYESLFESNKTDEENNVVNLNADLLGEICTAIKNAYGKKTYIRVEFSGLMKPVWITAKGINSSFRSLIMPIRP